MIEVFAVGLLFVINAVALGLTLRLVWRVERMERAERLRDRGLT